MTGTMAARAKTVMELKEEMRRLVGERIGKLWDEGIASGQALEGPPAMERVRSKYQAMQKSPVSKKARNPKR